MTKKTAHRIEMLVRSIGQHERAAERCRNNGNMQGAMGHEDQANVLRAELDALKPTKET